MPVTFQVVGNLADFGNDPRAGVKVRATATPGVKVGDVAVHSNEPETVVTDETGAFALTLISVPGVWYTIRTPYSNAINTVRLAGYTPDVEDPTTGDAFAPGVVINLINVMDEDPTPGYEGINVSPVIGGSYPVTAQGAKGDGITLDSPAFAAAILAANGKTIDVPPGDYLLNNVTIPAGKVARFQLAEGANLIHQGGNHSNAMFNVQGDGLRIRGGAIDGNRANQTGRPMIVSGQVQAGKFIDIEDVKFTGTVYACVNITQFGGYFNFSSNAVADQAQHTGVGSQFTTVATIGSGQEGQQGFIRTNHNRCVFTATPDRAGSNPGGFFVAVNGYDMTDGGGSGSLGFANGNLSTWEAIGNYFYGYGQHDGPNDISPLHTYPSIRGARWIGNYFEQCGFSAVSAKSVQDFVFTGNVIVNGMTSTKNTALEGAVAYLPGYQSSSLARSRAIIANNIISNPGGEPTLGQTAIVINGTADSYTSDVIVTDNVINGTGSGITGRYIVNAQITGNHINLTTGTTTSGQGYGVHLTNIDGDIDLSRNQIRTTNGDCINATASMNDASLTISGNTLRQGATSRYGAILRGLKFLKIADNTIDNPAGPAINVQSDGTNNVGHVVYDNSNTILAGAVSFVWAQIDKASGELSSNNTPVNIVVPGEVGVSYRQLNGAGAGILWTSTGTTATSWEQVRGSGAVGAPPEARVQSLAAWAYDPVTATTANAVASAGELYLIRMSVGEAATLRRVWFQVNAGTALTAGQCFVGLYSSAGELLAQASAETIFAQTGARSVDFTTPVAVSAGSYVDLAILWNGTTAPTFRGVSGVPWGNLGINAVADYRFSKAGSALTSLPSTLPTPKATVTTAPWFGIAV